MSLKSETSEAFGTHVYRSSLHRQFLFPRCASLLYVPSVGNARSANGRNPGKISHRAC